MDKPSLQDRLFSEDSCLNRMLQNVVREVSAYSEGQLVHMRRLAEIGVALSAEKNMGRLLEMIVSEARAITRADAGTLYTVDCGRGLLNFRILQNDTMKSRLGGSAGSAIDLPPIPLRKDGQPNCGNVSSYAALTGEIVNIPDVYEAPQFDFTGPREYDQTTGYRSRSMLVIPMRNHENDVIGVLQLLNALNAETGQVTIFSEETVDLVASLASQAAVALTNAQLIQNLTDLLHAFIKSIAAAIDEKSPFTGGHIRRVTDLTLSMAREINETREGPFAGINLTEDEMDELAIAAWMHDVGKIVTPDHVVDKRHKLETIFDRASLVETRFDLIEQTVRNGYLSEKVRRMERGEWDGAAALRLDRAMREDLERLREEREFVIGCNVPRETMGTEEIERLKTIGCRTFFLDGRERRYLTDDEIHCLSVTRGSLTPEERRIIEHHALMTRRILEKLPFPKRLARVPEFAGGHHEMLDGSGYPLGLTAERLPLQTRIMAIADIFEALTAKDRPYKQPMELSQAIRILRRMKEDGRIDADLFDFFVSRGLHVKYAAEEPRSGWDDEEWNGSRNRAGGEG
ncbi:MAG: HD domain-containing phosphohydrolase [Syntrophobacteraceae bacterium]|nr:GAF domain-containing protein [Desulfobacteraceae bacterium]